MSKKTLRTTISQMDKSLPLQGQPSRDTAALILPISAIKLGENIRRDLGDLSELIDSIKEHGILQSLVLAKTPQGLELVVGYRRLAAAREAGLTEVPVRIVGADANQIAVLRLVENLIRENLSGVDEVRAVGKLLPLFAGNQSALGRAIGKSPAYVSRCVRAAELIQKDLCDVAKLSKSVLFELAGSVDPLKALEELTREEKPTVQAARQAAEGRKPSGPIPGGHAVDRVIRYNERRGGKGFTLKIHFDFDKSSEGDRERLLTRLRELIGRLEKKD